MEYIFEQLTAYQHQLKELALHQAWQQHTQAGAASITPSTPSVSTLPPLQSRPQQPSAGKLKPWGQRSIARH